MVELAGVGWALSIVGWIMSLITTRLMNKGFSLIGFDESEKLRDLETKLLPRLALMLEEAERSPPSLRRAHVEQWAKRLRSAFYDAEDILDVADYHRLEKQVISYSHIELKLDHVQHIISGETSKLKKILKKLEKIIEEGSQFLSPLASTISNANGESNPSTEVTRIVTTSSGHAQVIIGRDEERDEIIMMLCEAPGDGEPAGSSNIKCYSVIGIYGVAGSGKTTLAQHVCSYERTEDHFCPIMWIHVSQSFDVPRIYQEMLEAVSNDARGSFSKFSNFDTLQMRLEAELTDKRFLLVLDDIWADKGVSVHNLDQLLSPLKVGGRGSKVLVTTRFKDAAMSLGAQTRSLFPIPDLNQNDFFRLFMRYALDGALDDHEQEIFLMIGREIVKKLKGSPLAARLVGARLRKKLDASSWRRVVDQDRLTDTMDALRWSYRHLDEHVRRCFAYCSIFPRRYSFERNELVKLWMAEDFIKTTDDGDQMEGVGQDYFDELVSCSFLQTGKWGADSDKEWFTMHDLLHDLAEMVAGNDFFRVEDGELKEFPRDVRHLFINLNDPKRVAEQICKMKKLRTLIIPYNVFGSGITEQVLEGMLKKLKKLRVVQVLIEGDMVMIPTCICDLKHLRCLTIYVLGQRSKVYLPRKFDKLYHLQILELPDSGVLKYSHVKNMSNLISLRHIRRSQNVHFPVFEDSDFPGVGKLKSLQELSDFRVRKEKGYELQQLESLNYLHGSLRISGLENVESKERALEAKLADKKYLTVLSLAWSPKQRYSPDLEVEIIEGLCPPSQLTELRVDGYDGWECPSWLSQNENALRGLQCLEIRSCSNLESIPEIGEVFVNLRELRLHDLNKLKRLPRLPDNLKVLQIVGLEDMVVTCVEDVEMIRSMLIERASQIEPSLKIANTEEIDRLADEQPDRFMAILCDTAGGSGMVSSIMPICGQIREEDYPQWLLPASLDHLWIADCTITDTVLHNYLKGCTALTMLVLIGIPFPGVGKLKSLQELSDFRVRKEKGYELQQLESLNYLHGSLRISGLENVESKERALEAKLTDKKYLTALSLAWSGEQRCSPDLEVEKIEALCPPSQLTELQIHGYRGRKYPSWLSQNENALRGLQCLEISSCSNLEAIPEIGEVFVHLRELILDYLNKLKRLPRLPDNLKRLEIWGLEDMVLTCVEDVEMIRSMLIERASQIEPSLKITSTEEIDRLADEQPDRFMEILCDTAGGSGGNEYSRWRIRRMVSSVVPFIRGQIREEDYPQLLLPASLDDLGIGYCTITDTVLHNCLKGCTALTTLQLYGTPFLRAIPCEVMKSLARLRNLRIYGCVNLTLLQGLNYLGHLERLDIARCPNLNPLQEGEKVRVRPDLRLMVDDISLVPQLLSREACSSLTSLRIWRSEKPSGGEILLQLTSLTSLVFLDCNMNSLPENLVNLTSLRWLTLYYLRNIRSLPTLPASLRNLHVFGCDRLFTESCQRSGHPNWQKVQHIPNKTFCMLYIFTLYQTGVEELM